MTQQHAKDHQHVCRPTRNTPGLCALILMFLKLPFDASEKEEYGKEVVRKFEKEQERKIGGGGQKVKSTKQGCLPL